MNGLLTSFFPVLNLHYLVQYIPISNKEYESKGFIVRYVCYRGWMCKVRVFLSVFIVGFELFVLELELYRLGI